MDDNIFDKDDALDYVTYEEVEKERKSDMGGGECLSILLFLLIPVGASYLLNIL